MTATVWYVPWHTRMVGDPGRTELAGSAEVPAINMAMDAATAAPGAAAA